MKIALALLLLAIGGVNAAHACSCIRESDDRRAALTERLKGASLVFLGRIQGNEVFAGTTDDMIVEYKRTQFLVLKSWRGTAGRVYVQSTITCCLCGYAFPDSGDFLVFAYGPDKDGQYIVNGCRGPVAVADAENDMVILDDLSREVGRTNRSRRSREERAPAER